jgi:hypothetical protein
MSLERDGFVGLDGVLDEESFTPDNGATRPTLENRS